MFYIAAPSSQLPTEDTWKKFIYPHYLLNESTPILAVWAELGHYPTFISGISRLAKYMSYITQETAPPLVRKAVLTQKVMAAKTKYNWWSNTWRILNHFMVKESDLPPPPPAASRKRSDLNTVVGGCDTSQTPITPLGSVPTVSSRPHSVPPHTWIQGHTTSAQPSWLLRFRCSNHWLNIELGRHLNVPRDDRSCRFCNKPNIGEEYHAFQCVAFLDLQVLCGVNVTSFPQFIASMQTLEIHVLRYISLIMSRIKLR